MANDQYRAITDGNNIGRLPSPNDVKVWQNWFAYEIIILLTRLDEDGLIKKAIVRGVLVIQA